jgi:glycosyltransferase 2 family protein
MQTNKTPIQKRSLWLILLAGFLSIASILFILSRMDIDSVAKILEQVNVSHIIASTCFAVGVQLIWALRWTILLEHRLPYLNAISAAFLGLIANAILPFRLGELVRARLIKRNHVAISEAIPSIILGQLLDVLVLVAFGVFLIVMGVFSAQQANTILLVGCVAVSILILFYFITHLSTPFYSRIQYMINAYFSDRLLRIVANIASNIRTGLGALNNPVQLFYASVLSLLFWLALAVGNWILVLSLIESPSILIGVVLALASGLGRLIPALPGDIGTLDAVVMVSILLLGVPEDIAITIMILIRIRYIVTVVLGGIIGLMIEGLIFRFSK